MSKKPWIWAACRSTVITRWTPAVTSMFATSLAVIGTRPSSLRSFRAYPKYGITAVTRPADARRSASMRIRSSIRLSFTWGHVDWTM